MLKDHHIVDIAHNLRAISETLLNAVDSDLYGDQHVESDNQTVTVEDPRTDSARDHIRDNSGKITGVFLTVHRYAFRTPVKFKVTYADVLGEDRSQGKHIMNIRLRGKNTQGYRPVLLTGSNGDFGSYDEIIEGKAGEFIIGNKFEPPNLSFLSCAIMDSNNNIVSEMVSGMGLPWGRHVSFVVEYEQVA